MERKERNRKRPSRKMMTSSTLIIIFIATMMMITIPRAAHSYNPMYVKGGASKRAAAKRANTGKKGTKVHRMKTEDLALLKNMTRDIDFTQYCWEPEVFKPTLFPLTFRQCRKGVVIEGDRSLWNQMAAKLEKGRCVRVVALGGSIAWGHHALSRKSDQRGEAFPLLLGRFLNERFPCDGGGHVVENLSVRAVGTSFWLSNMHRHASNTSTTNKLLADMGAPDLVLVETATNDVYDNAADTECLVRLLHTHFPRSALVWVTAGWLSFGVSSRAPHHIDSQDAMAPVLRHYGVTLVSLRSALEPFFDKEMRKWEEQVLFNDQKCHLSQLGHAYCAQLIGQLIQLQLAARRQEGAALIPNSRADSLPIEERPFRWSSPERVRDLLRPPIVFEDFRSAKRGGTAWLSANLDGAFGWKLGEDMRFPGKQGLLAERGGAADLSFPFETAADRHSLFVSIGTLHSYRSVGKLDARLIDATNNATLLNRTIDCIWGRSPPIEASVFHSDYLFFDKRQRTLPLPPLSSPSSSTAAAAPQSSRYRLVISLPHLSNWRKSKGEKVMLTRVSVQ